MTTTRPRDPNTSDAHQVDVWWTRLPTLPPARIIDELSDVERRRALARTSVASFQHSVFGASLVRRVASSYNGIPPAEQAVCRTCPHCGARDHGRPRLQSTNHDPQISLAHSADMLVVAVSTARIGVDVEPAVTALRWPIGGQASVYNWVFAEAIYKAAPRQPPVLGRSFDALEALRLMAGAVSLLQLPNGYIGAAAIANGSIAATTHNWAGRLFH